MLLLLYVCMYVCYIMYVVCCIVGYMYYYFLYVSMSNTNTNTNSNSNTNNVFRPNYYSGTHPLR
jgi:hypothetical protein